MITGYTVTLQWGQTKVSLFQQNPASTAHILPSLSCEHLINNNSCVRSILFLLLLWSRVRLHFDRMALGRGGRLPGPVRRGGEEQGGLGRDSKETFLA